VATSRNSIAVRSSLRLFLSVDIVGSTEFKQASRIADGRAAAMTIAWLEPFLSFYQLSIEQMDAQWARVCGEMSAVDPKNGSDRFRFGERPVFWKGAGDEVLFSKAVESPVDAMATIHAFLLVMQDHRTRFADKGLPLDVKGTAWLAGFPVNNAEAVLPGGLPEPAEERLDDPVAENYRLLELHQAGGRSAPIDYIGPSIDLGFRLREYATPRRLVVSADLVWLLCHAHGDFLERERSRCSQLGVPHVGYDGRRGLKGILGGQPYPLIWIEADPENDLDRAEDVLRGRPLSGASPSNTRVLAVKDYCALFLNGRTPLQTRPYIRHYPDPEIGQIPADHERELERIEQHVNGAREQLETLELPDDAASGEIPSVTTEFASGLAKAIEPQDTPTMASRPARRAKKRATRRK
jgi:hypothetical protein